MCNRKSATGRERGLVLLELLVGGCVLAILAALAAPGFVAISERLKLRSAVDALTASLYAARAEAYKRGGHVTLAQSTASDCVPTQGNSRWRCGWTLFADADEDGVRDVGDELILAEQPPPGIDVAQSSDRTALKLNAWGQFSGQQGVGFVLSSRARSDLVTVICISSGGRVRSVAGASRCPG